MSDASDAANLGQWAMMTVESDQGAALFRVRLDRPADPNIVQYDQSVIIRWPYSSDETGFPDLPTREAMDSFEEAIADLYTNNGVSYLMLVTTGMNLKEWLYYATDTDEFMRRFNEILADEPMYPLEIHFVEDATWEYWFEVQQKCLEAEEG